MDSKDKNKKDFKKSFIYLLSKDPKDAFVNPYNFVPLGGTLVRRAFDMESFGELTGYFDCVIHAKTQIAIPDSHNKVAKKIKIKKGEKEFEENHYQYPFMKDPSDEKPFIPAGSIRGVIRNVYETLTDSCLSTMPKERKDASLDARISPQGSSKAGILKRIKDGNDAEWELYPAKRYMIRVKPTSKSSWNNPEAWDDKYCPAYKADYRNATLWGENGEKYPSGTKVRFDYLKDNQGAIPYYSRRNIDCGLIATRISNHGECEGYVVVGQQMNNKHHESLFEIIPDAKPEAGDINEAVSRLESVWKVYENDKVNTKKKENTNWYPAFQDMKERGIIPVWYFKEANRLYLSLAAIGRHVYKNSLIDIVGNNRPCVKRNSVCDACSLFGMVGKKPEDKSLGSRIRFTDAKMINGELAEPIILAELGSPKSSYLPFYTNQTRILPGYDANGIKINGRKYYWHSKSGCKTEPKPTKRNATMECMNAGSTFGFRVYFDRITKNELEKLIYAIDFWEHVENGKMCHKIGHGKPIGLGSVKISINDNQYFLRAFDGDQYMVKQHVLSELENPFELSALDPKHREIISSMRLIADFDEAPETVSYPSINSNHNVPSNENDFAAHKWFNRNTEALKQGKPQGRMLPGIKDAKSKPLYKYKAEEKKK